jgi:hypothetical protein
MFPIPQKEDYMSLITNNAHLVLHLRVLSWILCINESVSVTVQQLKALTA